MSGDPGPQLVTMRNYQVDVGAMCRAYDQMSEVAEELMRLAPFLELMPLIDSCRTWQVLLRHPESTYEVRQ